LFALLAPAASVDAQDLQRSTSVREVYTPQSHEWRRTATGWTKVGSLRHRAIRPRQAVAFHPGLLAILQLLLSVAAFLVFEPKASWRNKRAQSDQPTTLRLFYGEQ